ncbi:hypothetical protein [Streptomyces sp. NPDC048142]|uniref:hypothetical protein n=1 Tax=Streptomyces sp. NPDC048142 TaxID=3365501 RepID=UPI003710329B
MRCIPLTFCAAAAAALIAVPAPAALASPAAPAGDDDRGTVSVTPSTIAPGGQVELWVDICGKGREAKGNSDAFASVARFRPADDKGLFAEARIRDDAEPRSYDIWVTCGDGRGKATGTLTVIHHKRPSPVAPVKAGGGGTATLAERSTEGQGQGPGVRHAVTGLVLAAVAAVAVALRGSRRRRGPAGS